MNLVLITILFYIFFFFTDFQNPLDFPQPEARSHLTIKLQSNLMSRPCPLACGPKPPVAPRPRPLQDSCPEEEDHCHSLGLCNGDLSHSDGEAEELHDMAEESLDKEGKSETNGTGELSGEDMGDSETEGETQTEGETREDDGDVDSLSSEDTVKGDDGSVIETTEDENTDNDVNLCDYGNLSDDDNTSTPSLLLTETEDEAAEEEKDPEQQSYSKNCCESPGLRSDNDAEKSQTQSGSSQADVDGDFELLEPDKNMCKDFKTELDAKGLAFGICVLPALTEEYPYDVIGLGDDASDTCESCDPAESVSGDTEVWQPERATKDLSGCFRFTSSTEDVFGPYSVIEAVPVDMTITADPEWSVDSTDDNPSDELQTPSASNQEPYYVSTDDVDQLDSKQMLSEKDKTVDGTDQSNQHKGIESADEYADIDDSLCPKEDDTEQTGGVSSEDYVEIGDEDEDEEPEKRHIKGKSVKERTAKRDQAFNSKRASCQPRIRLCNITVPADLDLGRTPELTNRVVFAHTTEAFEEDIEELDCHIVPYYEDTDSDNEEHIYEEAGFDSEGENFVALDRKSVVTRSRSYSGKFPGYVPETVPEETGTEYQTHDYCTVASDKNSELLSPSQQPGVNSLIPSVTSRRFLVYSQPADGPELSSTVPSEFKRSLNEIRIRRKDDTLSLPCVITSSGSFSQRSHQSSSGVSTPTSLVDIPPPFELAYITKRPVTKSSPSVLIQHEPSDDLKKKKSSFKRFLALKFKKKTDTKGFSDVSVRSSRSSSESSHHGPTRVIELERRSTGNSPQLQSHIRNCQQRSLELTPTFVHDNVLHKRKGDPRTYNKGVSRVESFEERSRRSVMPLPTTKPRSISFPSADTSDYENIPAMSSDYENIQIPGRPTRSHTVTEFFENPNRTTVASNENDGYVDMNSFPGIDSKPQTLENDTERYSGILNMI